MCHELYCRVCGGKLERAASGKGRVPEYHAACKRFAQALLDIERAVEDIRWQRDVSAQSMRSSLMMVLNRIPAQYNSSRGERGQWAVAEV